MDKKLLQADRAATPCGNISAGWICETEKSATAKPRRPAAVASSGSGGLGIRGHVAARIAEGRIVRGRIARGEVRLYQFAQPDKKRPALVLTRDSALAYLSTVTVAPATSTIRGVPSEVLLNQEDGMKSQCDESAQCSYGVATATGETGWPSLVPHE